MSFMPREIAGRAAFTLAATFAWGGCTSTPGVREPDPMQLRFTSANGRATAVVYSGFGAFETSRPMQTPFQEFLFGPQSTSSRRLRTPQGIAASGEKLWVCDQGYPDVLQIDPGSGRFRSVSDRAHRPASPVGVALDDQGNVFVADSTRRSVLVYGSDRSLLEELSPDATFEPTALLIHNSILYVADRGNRLVTRYDVAARAWQPPLPPPVDQPAFAVPTGIAMTTDGTLLVTDALLGIIHRIDEGGKWLTPLSTRGRGPGQLVRPIGICRTPGGLIAVADAARQAVVLFGQDGGHVLDIERSEIASPGWSLPMGVACLQNKPAMTRLDSATDVHSGDWIVVSDMLGENGLTLIHVQSGNSVATTGATEVE